MLLALNIFLSRLISSSADHTDETENEEALVRARLFYVGKTVPSSPWPWTLSRMGELRDNILNVLGRVASTILSNRFPYSSLI